MLPSAKTISNRCVGCLEIPANLEYKISRCCNTVFCKGCLRNWDTQQLLERGYTTCPHCRYRRVVWTPTKKPCKMVLRMVELCRYAEAAANPVDTEVKEIEQEENDHHQTEH